MTYGENSHQLRAHLATLLRQHRIQHRLGGPGLRTVPATTTEEQRRELGEQIRRYRQAVLVWCLQAATAAHPPSEPTRITGPSRGPVEELRYRLTHAIEASTVGLPALEELTVNQPFDILERWRHAARAAALGEHDFPAGVGYGQLDTPQCMTVLNDAADVTHALVVLDRRYHSTPGWQSLKNQGFLQRAATGCASLAASGEQDYTVDLRGWRPPPVILPAPPMPQMKGVLQAEHNLLIHLRGFPNALNLKRVIFSQREISHELADRATSAAPELVERWLTRERTYANLQREARNLGGRIGDGGWAAAEGANAISRLRKMPERTQLDAGALRDLDRLFMHVDARLAAILDHGVTERLYFLTAKLPRISDADGHLVHVIRERFVPVSSPGRTNLLTIVDQQLRPEPGPPKSPAGAARSREDFRAAVAHRPESRGQLGL